MDRNQSERSILSRDKLSTNQCAAFSAQVSGLNHRPRGFGPEWKGLEPSAIQHGSEAGRLWRQKPKGVWVHPNKETESDIIKTDLVFGKKVLMTKSAMNN